MKNFVLLLLVAQACSSQAFAFGSSRRVEKIFVHDNCHASIILEVELNREMLKNTINNYLSENGWKPIHFYGHFSDSVSRDSIAVRITDTFEDNSGSKCLMTSKLEIYAYANYRWNHLAINMEPAQFNCLNWDERQGVLRTLLNTIPKCKIINEAVNLNGLKAKEEIVEKQIIEIGEELKR